MLKIYFANAAFKKNDIRGRSVHIRQFINHSIALGHEIWMERGTEHDYIQLMPQKPISRLKTFRKMDVIYVRLQGQIAGACKYALMPYRTIMGSPLHVWEFNTFPIHTFNEKASDFQTKDQLELFKHYGKGCDLAICVSQKLSDYVQEFLGIKNSLVVLNGSDPDMFDPNKYRDVPLKNINDNKINILWMGSAELDWNDFSQLNSVVQILNDRGSSNNIVFHIIGANDSSAVGLLKNIYFHGKIPYKELPIWLSKMDIGLIIYKPGAADFNSPLKLFDYLSSELAVVSNDQPQIRDVLKKINAEDLIVDYGDAIQMANVIEKLIKNPARMRIIGNEGRKLVIDYYNWRRAVERTYEKIYELIEMRA